ncbi:MAG: hypothetical protein HY255_04500, partial [Betaproteobacteria bacterium]|nr:hypothetical protein [Betaproteobacteria bacterium]
MNTIVKGLHRRLVIAFSCLGIAFAAAWVENAIALNNGGEVHGSIYTFVRGVAGNDSAAKGNAGQIMLPDIAVHLQNVTSGVKSAPAVSDLNGTFRIPAQPQGEYKLCWSGAGYTAGCRSGSFILRSTNIHLAPQGIAATARAIYGTVKLQDGQGCRFIQGFIGANIVPTVTAALSNGKSRVVRVNNYGEYVVAGLPAGAIKTSAACEKAGVGKLVSLSTAAASNNLVLPNKLPTVGVFYAAVAGQAVRAVTAGTTARFSITAKSGGAFPLHYRWVTEPPVPGFVSQDAPAMDIKIAGPGLFSAYVLIHDDHGGNAMRRLSISTRPDSILFSGHVKGNNAASLAGAAITLNGVATTTDSGGNFVLTLPKEQPRYVLTIEKFGYQMVSKVFYAPVVGGTYELYQAQQVAIDPTKKIAFIERTAGNTERAGVQVLIDPDSLAKTVRGESIPAAGPASMHAASYDLKNGNNPLPGDFAGINTQGKALRLHTFGAADIAITDAAGDKLNLAPGKTATVRMPIIAEQLATAPATIPVWHYDANTGAWMEDGTATRNGNFYEAKVTHFSAVNMDLAFNDGACTRIIVDESIMPTPFKIRMTPQTGSAVSPDHQDQIVQGNLSVVVREPPNTDIKYEMIDSLGNVISAATQTVHTLGSSASGTMWNPAANPPYADCTSEVRYDLQTVAGLFPLPAKDFLTYQTPVNYLSGPQADTLTAAYYHSIDPSGGKTTAGDVNGFANWKNVNGFNRTGEVTTKYSNNYDLGFGREMHMQKGGQNGTCPSCVAYYVSNYPSVEDAVAGQNLIATVAMEYSPQVGDTGTPYTKFYVFGADGAIRVSAD